MTDRLEEVEQAAYSAFIYGLPMVENYVLMYDKAGKYGAQAFNRLASSAELLTPEDQDVVTPNNDTAYSSGWLDLRAEPQVLTVPAILHKRYWSFQFVDFFTNNFAYLGSRCEVGHPHEASYLLVGRNWSETERAPAGMEVICADTDLVLLLGRTQVFGENDLKTVENIQAQYRLQPLHAYLGAKPPAAAEKIDFIQAPPPKDMADALTALNFFCYMNLSFSWSTIPDDQAAMLDTFKIINVGPGLTFNPDAFTAPEQEAIKNGMDRAYQDIISAANTGELVNGWKMMDVTKAYFGTKPDDILYRAIVAYKGIYAHTPVEAVYPIANFDARGVKLNGDNQYKLTFAKEAMPPVNFFWSLSMYGPDQLFVVNDKKRYSISDRTPGIQFGDDNSLTIYLQHEPPAEEYVNNWLPTPSSATEPANQLPPGTANEDFYVVLRLYGPKDNVLMGDYVVPGLELVD